jgi:hypothetical protein
MFFSRRSPAQKKGRAYLASPACSAPLLLNGAERAGGFSSHREGGFTTRTHDPFDAVLVTSMTDGNHVVS